MRKNERKRGKPITSPYFSGVTAAHSSATKRKVLPASMRRNRRKKGKPVTTSRYFPKVVRYSSQLSTSQASATKIRSSSAANEKGLRKSENVTDPLPKIAAAPNVDNGNGKTITDSFFTVTAINPPVTTTGATSNYFLRSPSSAYGSVLSLGPLVYTWITSSNYQDIRSHCLRQISSSASKRKVCNACYKTLREDAFRHFEACPIFRKELYAYESSLEYANGNSLPVSGEDRNLTIIPCVELVGQWAEEHSLRHLCPNQCFLRAFAPSREWMILRKKLEKLTPIGEILKDWTCRLVYETEANQDDVAEITSALSHSSNCIKTEIRKQNLKAKEKLLPIQLPRTLFVSLKSGKVRNNCACLSLRYYTVIFILFSRLI